jgi:hypothetical protein
MSFPSTATGSNLGMRMTGAKDMIPKGYRLGQLQQFTPEQMNLFQGLFSHLQPDSYLSRLAGGDQGMFDEVEAPALRQFGALQGNIASRFSGRGTGSRRSSGFYNTMNQAASDFAQQLQSQRMGLQRQAIEDLFGLSQSLLGQRPTERFLTEKQMPFWKSLLGGLIPGVGQGIGSYATGHLLGGK